VYTNIFCIHLFTIWTRLSFLRDGSTRRFQIHALRKLFPYPFTLNGIWSWWHFSSRFWTKWNLVEKQKENLSPRPYPIQCEMKWKHSFLIVIPTYPDVKCSRYPDSNWYPGPGFDIQFLDFISRSYIWYPGPGFLFAWSSVTNIETHQ